MTRRTLITRVLSAFAGCVLARTPLAGKSWEPPQVWYSCRAPDDFWDYGYS